MSKLENKFYYYNHLLNIRIESIENELDCLTTDLLDKITSFEKRLLKNEKFDHFYFEIKIKTFLPKISVGFIYDEFAPKHGLIHDVKSEKQEVSDLSKKEAERYILSFYKYYVLKKIK